MSAINNATTTSNAYGIVQEEEKLNIRAVVSFITSLLLIGPAAVVFGHVALSQLSRQGGRGRLFAFIGTALGYAQITLVVFYALGYFLIIQQHPELSDNPPLFFS